MFYNKMKNKVFSLVFVIIFLQPMLSIFPKKKDVFRLRGIVEVLEEINGSTHSFVGSLFVPEPSLEKLPLAVMNRGRNIGTDEVYFKDVIGLDDALKEVSEVVEFLKNPEKFKAMGAYIPKGILLEGDPGNGKTLIAKAIANESRCSFFYESASNFVEMYVGVGAGRVRALFDRAREASPAIVFIDEIDAIGAVDRGAGGNAEYRQTLNALLDAMDGFNTDGQILVIAATNHANALDSALRRAGRFDRIIKINPPNESARVALLRYYIEKLPRVSADVNDDFLQKIAKATDGLSAVDFKTMVNEAPMIAIRSNDCIVAKKHIAAAFERVMEQRKPQRQNNIANLYKVGRQ